MRHTVTEHSLKNGAKGLLIHIPDALVMSFDLNFRAGEYLVEDKKWEVPHLMEHVLLGANELIPKARDFQAELEKNGAYSNASTGVYDITYEAECADFEWERVLGLLQVAICKPLFLDDEFNAEFGNVQEEMVARSNNHFRRLSLDMRKSLGLIAKSDVERLELMKNVTVDDVKEHYKNTHNTQNLRFVIAGNLKPARQRLLLNLLENMDLPNEGKRFALPHEKPAKLDRAVYIPNDTVENIYFYIDTFMKRRMSEEELDSLSLLTTILTDTLYSRILGTARERGLVYGMNSGISYTKDVSNWWFGTQVSDKNARPLLKIMVDELHSIFKGDLKESEINAAKQYALGRFQRSGQTVGATASAYAGKYFFDGVIENYMQIPARIEAISKPRIIQVASEMFADDVWGIGILGNCGESFAEDLKKQITPLWTGLER